MECASVRVPTDYAHPAAGTTTIRLGRIAATGDSRGPLLMNPGGPGGSGVQFVGLFANAVPRLHAAYDLIGFDPRGVGSSDPVRCLDTAQLDELTAINTPPSTAAQAARRSALIRQQGNACRAHAGALASHMTTVETARDLDIIRAALASPRLDYYGASYGTFLGATYAALFPHRIGRMVLDGALDPELSHDQVALGQAYGFQHELDAMIDHCLADGSCPLGDSRAQAMRRITQLLARAAREPVPTGDERPLTQGLAMHGLAEGLYRPDGWDGLDAAVGLAEQGHGAALRRFSDAYYRRREGRYISNETEAYTAIDCLDAQANPNQRRIPLSRFLRASPVFGAFLKADNATCRDWPLKTSVRDPDYHLSGAPPIVVLSTTGDPATPYAWGVRLATELGSGVLVTRVGEGHTAYAWGNRCIDNAVDRFLVDGTSPPGGLRC
jgi:pimeloyl-ACP methyl ester carboxylesterase